MSSEELPVPHEERDAWLAALPEEFDDAFFKSITFKQLIWLEEAELNEEQQQVLKAYTSSMSARMFGAEGMKPTMDRLRSAMKPIARIDLPSLGARARASAEMPELVIPRNPTLDVVRNTRDIADAVITLADATEAASVRERKMLFWSRLAGWAAVVGVLVGLVGVIVAIAIAA